jgi:hypothetical protein
MMLINDLRIFTDLFSLEKAAAPYTSGFFLSNIFNIRKVVSRFLELFGLERGAETLRKFSSSVH